VDIATISARITTNVNTLATAVTEFTNAFETTMKWIQRDWQLYEANGARPLLTGAKVTLLEAATAWAIGSNRGAAASLRAAIENSIAWLYYKDHPIEFSSVKSRRSDLLLPKAVQSYFKANDAGFEASYAMLAKLKNRPSEYYYSDVSEYVHAHPSFVLPGNINDLVITAPRDPSFLSIVKNTNEFITDNYTAFYRSSWGDFPESVQIYASGKLGVSLTKFVEIAP